MARQLYAGPGKLFFNAIALWPEGDNGAISARVIQEAQPASTGMHGRQTYTQGNGNVEITMTPFDNWGALATLFPAYLGVKVGLTAAALVIGTRPHNPAGAGDAAAKIWSADNAGRMYTFPRAGIIRHPDLHLGVGKALFGPITMMGLLATGKNMGDAAAFYTITETAAADPGGQMTLADFERGEWTGAWGTVAGFGGDGGATMEAEDQWTITSEIRYTPLPVQKLVRAYKLDSVAFMAKFRPYGPTHTQIDTQIGLNNGRILGARFANPGNDLLLTGPGGKTITLKNADVVGAGFEFGGTRLGNGEVGFVNGMTYTAGAPNSLLEFSA